MECKRCAGHVGGRHLGVRLTLVCESCVKSDELATKTHALSLGVRPADLSRLDCLYRTNPHYRSAPMMRLYVPEELRVLSEANGERKRGAQESTNEKKERKAAGEALAKKARIDCYNKRLERLRNGTKPTPGLVSGDFCSTGTKTPKVGARLVMKRRDLWNRCSRAQLPVNVAVQVFRWATSNSELETTVAGALERIRHEKFLFDRIATAEGHRVLQSLDNVDRLVLLRANPAFEDALHGLPVKNVPTRLSDLCHRLADLLGKPFDRVLSVMDVKKNSGWLSEYMHVIPPERLASVLSPHFHGERKKREALLARLRDSFSNWGLVYPADARTPRCMDSVVNSVVDVEYISAKCYLWKHGFARLAPAMDRRGGGWMEATKELVGLRALELSECLGMMEEDKPRSGACTCGGLAARLCVFNKCGNCCRGPCARHKKRKR